MIEEHGHRRLPPTGFETRTVSVEPGVDAVSYPIPTYDEQATLGCPQCMALGARRERERIRDGILAFRSSDGTVQAMADAAESVLMRAIGVLDDEENGDG